MPMNAKEFAIKHKMKPKDVIAKLETGGFKNVSWNTNLSDAHLNYLLDRKADSVVQEAEELDSLMGDGGKIDERAKPPDHVVHEGERARKPTDEEILERKLNTPIKPKVASDDSVTDRLKNYHDVLNRLSSDKPRFNQLDPFQRYAILGARYLAAEVLGLDDGSGRTASLARALGIDPATGRLVSNQA